MPSKKDRKPTSSRRERPPGVLREAWENMNRDLDRFMPETLRRGGKKKFVLWLFLLEVVVLVGLALLAYEWFSG